jgi:hypothetical protein
MLMSFLQQNQSQGQNGTCLNWGGEGGKGGGRGQDGEMTQTMYAHVNKWITTKKTFKKLIIKK